MEALVPLVAIILTFGIPGIIIFWWINSKHTEKMKLIEKGLTPEEVKAYFTELDKRPKNPYSALKWGMLLTFVGLGFFLSYVLTEFADFSDAVTPAFILFFAGIGFLLYFSIVNSKLKKRNTNGNAAGN